MKQKLLLKNIRYISLANSSKFSGRIPEPVILISDTNNHYITKLSIRYTKNYIIGSFYEL